MDTIRSRIAEARIDAHHLEKDAFLAKKLAGKGGVNYAGAFPAGTPPPQTGLESGKLRQSAPAVVTDANGGGVSVPPTQLALPGTPFGSHRPLSAF